MVRAPASSGAALDDGCNVAEGPAYEGWPHCVMISTLDSGEGLTEVFALGEPWSLG